MTLTDLIIISFCDPSAGKNKAAQRHKAISARSAIVTIGVDHLTRIFVLEAWADRCPTEKLTARLFDTYRRFPTMRVFGMEANAMQSLFADSVALQARAQRLRIPFTPIYQPTHIDKHWRVRTTLQPVIGRGRLFLQPDQHELRAELSSFPLTPVVDLVDGLASAVALAPIRPVQQTARAEQNALASYLRRAGVSPDRIAERVRQLSR